MTRSLSFFFSSHAVLHFHLFVDLGDKEMKEMRNKRWEKAFQNQVEDSCSADASATDSSTSASFYTKDKSRDLINRKATIVIEHLIQAGTSIWELDIIVLPIIS